MKKRENQRLAVLVDAENLEISAQDIHQRRVDYRALLAEVNGREIIRAIYFKPEDRLSPKLGYVVENLGFEIKTPPKNVDCWLTISAVSLADKCDAVALFAGDKDYVPLVWYLQSRGVRVEVWMFSELTANDLKKAADHFEALTPRCLLEPWMAPRPDPVARPTLQPYHPAHLDGQNRVEPLAS